MPDMSERQGLQEEIDNVLVKWRYWSRHRKITGPDTERWHNNFQGDLLNKHRGNWLSKTQMILTLQSSFSEVRSKYNYKKTISWALFSFLNLDAYAQTSGGNNPFWIDSRKLWEDL